MHQALRRILVGPPASGRTSQLLRLVRQAAPPPAQVLVLTPSEASQESLRRQWGQLPGCEIVTVRGWALELLRRAASGQPGGPRLLSPLSRRLLLRHAWQMAASTSAAGASSLYQRYGDGVGADAAIEPLFDLLAASLGSAAPQSLSLPAGSDLELVELGMAYARYLALCQQHGLLGLQEAEGRLCDALSTPALRALLPWSVLVFDDLDAATPAQQLLFVRLAETLERAGRPPTILAAVASLERDDDERRALLLRLLGPLKLEQQPLPPRLLPAGAMLARLDTAQPSSASPCLIRELRQPEDECHAIAQEIAADLLDRPKRCFADYAIVCWNSETLKALSRVLSAYGLPLSGVGDRSVSANPLLPPLRAGAALLLGTPLEARFERDLLRGPLAQLSYDEALSVSLAPGGLLALLEGRATVRLGQRAAGAVASLAAALAEARTRMRFWERLLLWLERSGALAMLDHDGASLPLSRLERDACGRQISRALQQLSELELTAGRLGQELRDQRALLLLDQALGLVDMEPALDYTDAVQLWLPADLHGRSASVVFLAGLDEESLPALLPPLQPAGEQALYAAFGHLPAFVAPQRESRQVTFARARAELALALSRATEHVVLSYSYSHHDGRPLLPSPLFLELLGPQAILHERLALAADEQGALLISGLGPNNPPLQLSLETLHELPPAAQLPDLALIEQLLATPQAPPLALAVMPLALPGFRASASAIREYLSCPRRYFYGRALALDEGRGERLALGQLFHKVVERLLGEWEALAPRGRLRRGLKLFQEHWPAYADRLGPPLHQASYRRMARDGLAALIQHETEAIRPSGRRHIALEARFELRWRDGSLISGVIDRVDQLPDGRYAVIDYKTGDYSPTLKELLEQFIPFEAEQEWQPSDVQLPLYAYALERGLVEGLPAGPVAEVSLLYPFKLRTASGKLSEAGWRRVLLAAQGSATLEKKHARVSWPALEACWDQLDRVLSEMRSGPFPPAPREHRICRSCSYRFTCPQPAGDEDS